MIVRAPLPGKIVRLYLKPHEYASKGQLLLTMESMKMILPVCSFEAGEAVYEVGEGDIVMRGEIITRIFPS